LGAGSTVAGAAAAIAAAAAVAATCAVAVAELLLPVAADAALLCEADDEATDTAGDLPTNRLALLLMVLLGLKAAKPWPAVAAGGLCCSIAATAGWAVLMRLAAAVAACSVSAAPCCGSTGGISTAGTPVGLRSRPAVAVLGRRPAAAAATSPADVGTTNWYWDSRAGVPAAGRPEKGPLAAAAPAGYAAAGLAAAACCGGRGASSTGGINAAEPAGGRAMGITPGLKPFCCCTTGLLGTTLDTAATVDTAGPEAAGTGTAKGDTLGRWGCCSSS
jgi:hypothetical protein